MKSIRLVQRWRTVTVPCVADFMGQHLQPLVRRTRKIFVGLRGKMLLKSYLAENGTVRQFCSVCGSSMTFAPANDDYELVEFTLGTLSDPLEPCISDAHIYVGSKADWYAIEIERLPPQFKEAEILNRWL